MNKFIDETKKIYIKNLLEKVFISLNKYEFNIFFDKYCEIIDFIALKFCFIPSKYNEYWIQLKTNRNQNLLAIIFLILPYISPDNELELLKKIEKLEDISVKKKSNFNIQNNNYLISNVQFSRYFEVPKFYDTIPNKYANFTNKNMEEYGYWEYKYNISDMNMNIFLLKNTIDIIANKLHVNWINILPMSISDYKNSLLYRTSIYLNPVDNLFYYNNDDELELLIDRDPRHPKYSGIYLGDIYNVYVNDLYNNIIDIKWLLYEKAYNANEIPKNLIYILNQYVKISYLLKNKDWNIMKFDEKIKFEINIHNYLSFLDKSDLLRFLIFFEFKISNIYDIKNMGYEFYFVNKDMDIDREEEIISNFPKDEMLNNIKKIDISYLYEFVKESVIKFSRSWYGKKMIIGDDIILEIKDNNNNVISNNGIFLTYKNIYNFAKAMQFVSTENFLNVLVDNKGDVTTAGDYYNGIKNPDHYSLFTEKMNKKSNFWFALDRHQMLFFINSIQNNNNEWFDIKNVLHITYPNLDLQGIMDATDFIYNSIKTMLIDITFETLIYSGSLSEFKPCDIAIKPENDKLILKYIENNVHSKIKYYNETYYYLNNLKYGDLDVKYIKNTTKNDNWHKLYSFDWISQINFFHHFINNRVLIVSAGTGQGKSTQLPKLYLYALKIINRNDKPKVLCTQPRIIPTLNNAKIISKQMGVPIEKSVKHNYNDTSDIITNNGYVQYTTKYFKHNVSKYDSFIRYVTDKTLLEEIIKNPYLKKNLSMSKNPLKNFGDSYNANILYSKNNVYDIIMIDESHEHNKNMDHLLTLLRHSLVLNLNLKIAIVSATLDDDEHIYRRYFRFIDDDAKYPLLNSYFSLFKIRNADQKISLHLTSNVVDRRIHIAPPLDKNLYEIKEFYLDRDFKTYDECEKYAISLVKNICSTTNKGNILLFSTTKFKILNIINELIKITPNDVVIIPMYRDLPEDFMKIFQKSNLNELISDFEFEKSKMLEHISSETKSEFKFSYKRYILVATNIIEASITYNDLVYVIDTGYANNSTIVNGQTKFEISEIAEMNRIQRKGRTGRLNDGVVYYTYKKDSKKFNKIYYQICLESNKDIIYNLLSYSENPIYEKQIKMNEYYKVLHEMIAGDSFLENKIIKNNKKYYNGLLDVLIPQYYYMSYSNKTDIDDFPFEYPKKRKNIENGCFNIEPALFYIFEYKFNLTCDRTGYKLKSLLDLHGDFYLIHPYEDCIIRNCVTGVVLNENELLGNNRLYTDVLKLYSDMSILSLDYGYKDFMYVKSELMNIIVFMSSMILLNNNYDINLKLIKTIIYSFLFDCHIHVILICSAISGMLYYNLREIIKKYNNKKEFSEILMLYNMFDDLIVHYNYLPFFKSEYYHKELDKSFENDVKHFLNIKQLVHTDNYANITKNDIVFYNKFIYLDNTNQLDKAYLEYYEIKNYEDNFTFNNIEKSFPYFKTNKLISIIEKFKKIMSYFHNHDILVFIEKIKNNIKISKESQKNNVLKCFIYGFSNIAYVIDEHFLITLFNCKKFSYDNYDNNSFVKLIPKTFVLYINSVINDNGNIELLMPNIISDNYVSECLGFIYNKKFFTENNLFNVQNLDFINVFNKIIKSDNKFETDNKYYSYLASILK